MANSDKSFWAIVEVMGHRRFAGLIDEQVIAGAGFIRVDVPAGQFPAFTKLIGPSSIYAITPVDEAAARAAAARFCERPIEVWALPALVQPPPVVFDDDEEDDDSGPPF
ncbi:MAG: acetyltransferase [Myxococcales bacterium]|nr:acetyltransferase [Myxococcales bacterium]